MSALAFVFSSGWASGLNCYLVVLVLGVADRVHDTDQVPNVLARWDVLGAAAFLYAMEFVADKIPYVDSTWDVVSTAIRPTAGAVAGVVGGGSALLSHAVKTGARLAINSSPEPVTNIGASITEDVAVLGVVWFAIDHPRAAAAIAAVLLLGGLVLLFVLGRLVRRGWRRWKGRDRVPEPT